MISVAELKQHLRIAGDDEDAYIASLEVAAVQFIETQTRRTFSAVHSVTEFRRPVGISLYLSDVPTGTVTVVRRLNATAAPEEVATSEFAVRGQRLINPNGWGRREYQVTYSTGYESGEEPEDIRGLVRDLVALAYRARGGIETDMGGGVRFSGIDSIVGMRDTLRAYSRKPGFGVA